MNHFDVVVLGAGAAGLFAAMRAGQRERRVALLDHAEEPGKKILISGGGRCNFTNTGCVPDRFLSQNRHFARSALARYTQHDFIALVQKHRIAFHEKTLGQLFCDGSARQIVAMLVQECEAAGVDLRCHTRITSVTKDTAFRIETSAGAFTADSLVVATGSLSIPKMGATGFAHDLAMQFGLPLTEIRPALVPLTFGDTMLELMRPLSGLALDSVAKAGKAAFREAMLFTHRGLSGPAILQASSYWREGQPLTLDLTPDRDATAALLAGKRARPKAEAKTVLGDLLPARLAAALAALHLPPRTIGEIGDGDLRKLGAMLKAWTLKPSGTEGYAKAEVTLGGVDTEALSSQTMMAKSVPGLFFVGEAVDVTGWLGGYNFQWAWSSGWAAGEAA
ncbi:NAD(P)/FAD-dependent oxidoreductase [Roseomonas stagni]|uniref:NAD(P)/FAD-dependent oxidoreductase n=1 Tax=Falsiroseomonas algicola TaxID=2716930 RepID=A0A6M1LQ56_9PROT|nr:NAD(P)/FAD-dependent oxidoreductase [Falsiroseomonas algicola]NGM22162.1 NAD(P)/FAD-dependent oxidoreductase [Falsiroseomonas algicola]